MELHRRTTDSFIKYLEQHGYPTNTIVLEWGTRNCSIDIAIVADDGITPVAIYEIKGKKDFHSITAGINQLKRAREILDLTVTCSLVFGIENEPFFEVIDVSKIINNNEEADIKSILNDQTKLTEPLSYKNIKNGINGKVILQKLEKKQKSIDKLKLACWLFLPLILLLIMVLDALCIYSLNTERLIILGGLMIIVLIPFFPEISLKDILHLKRNDNKDNN